MAAPIRPRIAGVAGSVRLLVSVFLLACGSGSESSAPAAPQPYARPVYTSLRETALYANFADRTLAEGVVPFEPAFALWSDGADKQRWIQLPEGTAIDTSDMDRWLFPIGTRVWKQFALGGVALETRLIERYGSERDEYWMGAFVWNADQSDATFVELGQEDLLGTPHDAPASERCGACHNGEPGRILGFSALQLGQSPENAELTGPVEGGGGQWTLARLQSEERLSAPPPAGPARALPEDATTAAAFGYMHANCGHCHNPRGTSWPDTQMVLRLDVESPSAEDTELYRSVVNQELQYYRGESVNLRVTPGDAQASALVGRMSVRGPKEQMPPLATELVDPVGIDLISQWITSLPP
jgi:hypothetical protein